MSILCGSPQIMPAEKAVREALFFLSFEFRPEPPPGSINRGVKQALFAHFPEVKSYLSYTNVHVYTVVDSLLTIDSLTRLIDLS